VREWEHEGVEERKGLRSTHDYEEMTAEKRPQDSCSDGTGPPPNIRVTKCQIEAMFLNKRGNFSTATGSLRNP
jgi:hypothetical protein